MTYEWYEVIKDNSLQQGDIIRGCPVIQFVSNPKDIQLILDPNGEEVDLESSISYSDVIILSQSCDLENGKIETVLICSIESLCNLRTSENKILSKREVEKLVKGESVYQFVLNKHSGETISFDYLVADFRVIYTISRMNLMEIIKYSGDRVRLLPPYREHLAQSYAKFLMRIGLPQSIDDINAYSDYKAANET